MNKETETTEKVKTGTLKDFFESKAVQEKLIDKAYTIINHPEFKKLGISNMNDKIFQLVLNMIAAGYMQALTDIENGEIGMVPRKEGEERTDGALDS